MGIGHCFPDVEELSRMARVLKTKVSHLLGETDDEFLLPNSVVSQRKWMIPLCIERLVKSTSIVEYDTGKERMLIPATKEGFNL